MPTERQREVFARTIRALEPYASDIVLIGGWVHAMYVSEAGSSTRPVYTSDIDFTVPPRLPVRDRAPLRELILEAGYEVDEIDAASGIAGFWQMGEREAVIDLDLLTDAATPRDGIVIEGQPGLVVPGYPNQRVLLENARWATVGPDIHPSLDPPCHIRIPTVGAYVLVKGLSAARRPSQTKRAKDIVYLLEIVRDETMGGEARSGIAALAPRYPEEYGAWREVLTRAVSDRGLMAEVANQLREGVRMIGPEAEVARLVAAHIRRLLGETPDA